MKELNLHGVRHDEAKQLIERFIYSNASPIKIITGNSPKMKAIVNEVLNDIWLNEGLILNAREESEWNQGAVIITTIGIDH